MAMEPKRGCGYRKVGGLYLCGEGPTASCCKMPIELHVCPTCNGGIKQSRGWQWIDPRPWIKGQCVDRRQALFCVLATDWLERVGLIWIGTQFYPTPGHFLQEARTMGVSRRLKSVPRDFVLGETWVFFAHSHLKQVTNAETGLTEWIGGVFQIFKPTRLEKLVTETQSQDADEMAALAKKDITPIVVPDNDRDHQGTVYDDDVSEEPVRESENAELQT